MKPLPFTNHENRSYEGACLAGHLGHDTMAGVWMFHGSHLYFG